MRFPIPDSSTISSNSVYSVSPLEILSLSMFFTCCELFNIVYSLYNMSHKRNISTPIQIPEEIEVKPLILRDKDLPPLPASDRIAALELELDALLKENKILRAQLNIAAHQIKHYRQVACAAKDFVKQVMSGNQYLQEATATMKRAERAAEREWKCYQGTLENHMAFKGTIEDFI
jgi:hypothetical protein